MIDRETAMEAIKIYETAKANSLKFAECKSVSTLTLATRQFELYLRNPLLKAEDDVLFDVTFIVEDLQKFAHSIFLRERENLINLGIQP